MNNIGLSGVRAPAELRSVGPSGVRAPAELRSGHYYRHYTI